MTEASSLVSVRCTGGKVLKQRILRAACSVRIEPEVVVQGIREQNPMTDLGRKSSSRSQGWVQE